MSSENAVEAEVEVRVGDIDKDLVHHVKALTAPVFVLFDFSEFTHSVYAEIITNFVQGRVT